MLATSVIGLREGLEAALIVGIIAAFLRHQGRRDLIRWVFVGVGTAAVLCVAAGVALDVYSRDLPQRQQEGLETVIGALAVGMVTYMVVWMKRHSRELKGQLETMATGALGDRSRGDRSRAARAMVLMAFLAVLREGIETVIFLLAVFDQSAGSGDAAVGAVLGILVAVALGYGIYRGAVRVNLSRFFRATGFVLVLVAAGLVVNALHTAHEAGWLDIGQGQHRRPHLARRSRLGAVLAADRHARAAAAPGRRRADRLAGLPRPGGGIRRVAARARAVAQLARPRIRGSRRRPRPRRARARGARPVRAGAAAGDRGRPGRGDAAGGRAGEPRRLDRHRA